MVVQPWQLVGKGGGKPRSTPWTYGNPGREGRDQEVARLAAEIASGIHSSMSWGTQPRTANRGWDHRKAEWECSSCHWRNFLDRTHCSGCACPRKPDSKVHPEGSPPPPKVPFATAGQEAPEKKPLGNAGGSSWKGKASEDVQLAESAVAAAIAAGAPPQAVETLKQHFEAKQKDHQAKQPFRQRLQEATAKANQATSARAVADQRLAEATEEMQKAQEIVHKAKQEEEAAALELRRMTAELGTAPAPQKPDAQRLLGTLLEAIRGADTGGPGTREALMEAMQCAEATLASPKPMDEDSSGAPQPQQQVQPAKATAADSALNAEALNAEALSAEALKAAEEAKRAEAEKRAAELFEQLETDATPENKRARLQEALRQAWGQDLAPFLATQAS